MIASAFLTAYALLAAILAAYLASFAVVALFAARRRGKKVRAVALRPEDRVSVIIPAHNEETVLPQCLDALLKQDLSRVDAVIIALNGCSDRTEEITDRYARRFPLITKVTFARTSKVAAILAAMRRAKSRHVVVMDADMHLENNALRLLLRFHFGGRRSISTCLIDPLTEDAPAARIISCDRLFRTKILNLARDTWGMANVPGNLFVVDTALYRDLMRRETLLEDNELTYQLWSHGKSVAYLPRVIACERERLTLRNLVRQRRRWVLGNIDTLHSFWRAAWTLPWAKRLAAFSYPLLWYVLHYALALGSALSLFIPVWRIPYLSLASLYAVCVALSLRLCPSARTRFFTIMDVPAHVLIFPWAVTAATCLALHHLWIEPKAFVPESNRSSFMRDLLVASART